jgi:hypothetical protein
MKISCSKNNTYCEKLMHLPHLDKKKSGDLKEIESK